MDHFQITTIEISYLINRFLFQTLSSLLLKPRAQLFMSSISNNKKVFGNMH